MVIVGYRKIFAVSVGAWVVVSAYAQGAAYDPSKYPTMDAGALTRQAEQSYKRANEQRAYSRLAPIERPLVLPANQTIRAQKFEFNGVNLIDRNLLEVASSHYLDRNLTSADLENLCTAVVDAYRQAGWVVRVYVPRQSLDNPILKLQVLETVPPSSPQ